MQTWGEISMDLSFCQLEGVSILTIYRLAVSGLALAGKLPVSFLDEVKLAQFRRFSGGIRIGIDFDREADFDLDCFHHQPCSVGGANISFMSCLAFAAHAFAAWFMRIFVVCSLALSAGCVGESVSKLQGVLPSSPDSDASSETAGRSTISDAGVCRASPTAQQAAVPPPSMISGQWQGGQPGPPPSAPCVAFRVDSSAGRQSGKPGHRPLITAMAVFAMTLMSRASEILLMYCS